MNAQELQNIIIPPATLSGTTLPHVTITYHLVIDQDTWYLAGNANTPDGDTTDQVLLEPEDIIDVLDETLDVDQYCQDDTFREHQTELARRIGTKISTDHNRQAFNVQIGPYMRQQHVTRKNGKNYLQLLTDAQTRKIQTREIPEHLRVQNPGGYIPDEEVLSGALQRIYEGQPCTAIIGPTGSGKSALARYIGAMLNKQGYAVHIIDANSRLEGDRLFDRDDFDQNGTFILEGVLCTLARETRTQGLKLLVVLEEYNAFTDETRREFYRLFSDQDRYYPIQSSKDNKLLNKVDFSHVQFLVTANPLSSDKYLTDDLKRLSNAETRRMVILYLDYASNDQTIKRILQSLVQRKPGYQALVTADREFEQAINWQLGIDLFRELNRRGEGETLGYDVGYTAVADTLWTATLRSHEPNNLVTALSEHILNGIPDVGIRTVAADRIRQAIGVHIPAELILRDA